ncbi:MAG: PAS domain S-box protein [Bacteroidota bacterium]|nr:PAS domain S-box protein [Kiloniellaceae bacterium]
MSLAAHPEVLPSLQALLGDNVQDLSDGFLDLLPVGVYLCDREGRVVEYNRTAAELWGQAPRRGDPEVRYCGSYRMRSLAGEIIAHGDCPMAEALERGESRRDEMIVIERYDGSRITALVNIEPIKDAEGRVLGAVNVFRDHSARDRERRRLDSEGRRLDTLLQAMPVAIYTTDAEGRIAFFNEAAAALWGRRPALGEEARYCGSWKLFWPDGRPLPFDDCPMALALKTQTAIEGMEAVAERPDGTRVPFLAYPTPLFDGAGRLTGAVNVLMNLTERHAIHEQLRSSEARYRAIFDNAQVSVWEVDFSDVLDFLDALRAEGVTDLGAHLDTHPDVVAQAIGLRRITGLNAYTLELFGARSEAALLRSLASVRTAETEALLRDELLCLWDGRRRLERDTVLRRLDGGRMDVVVTVAFAGERAERSVATIHDVTERKTAELAAQRLAAIVESSDDAILSKNLDGIIMSWNGGAERLFGYTAEEALGQPVTMLIPPERLHEETIILGNVRGGTRIQHYETVRQRKDGSLVNISLTVSPIKTADGTIVGASKIARDITDRVEAQKQQDLLLREMNHRVKNLLTLSSGLVSLSARYAATPGELATAVQERLSALARAHEMILPPSPEAGPEHRRSTTLHALIRTIVTPYDTPVGGGPSRIVTGGCDTEIAGRAVTGFALLLHEFATNAAKYGALSRENGRVDIDCAEDGDDFVIVWQETGGPAGPPEPEVNGFGSVLSRATVKGQLRGTLEREWNPDGLTIRLRAPKERLLS